MSNLNQLNIQEMTQTWRDQVEKRMRDSGRSEAEISEAMLLIGKLVPLAGAQLKDDPRLFMPDHPGEQPLGEDQAKTILDLFVRGVMQSAHQLRQIRKPRPLTWPQRAQVLESAAWELFNMSRLLVAMRDIPGQSNQVLKSAEDCQVMMKNNVVDVLNRHLPKGTRIPTDGQQGGIIKAMRKKATS